MKRFWTFVIAAFLAVPLAAQSEARSRGRVYSVIFAVDVDAQGQITGFNVEKVIDPKSGSTKAVDVPVPATYIAVARARAATTTKSGEAKRYFTYFFFDPSVPDTVDVVVR